MSKLTEMSLEERLRQYRDEICPVQYLLLNGHYPPELTRNQIKNVRRQKAVYMMKENKLHKFQKRRNVWVQVITTPGEVHEILKMYHVVSGCHRGVVKTKAAIGDLYFWKDMTKDIENYISSCPTCQTFEPIKTQAPTLKQIKVSLPMEVVGMDLIGPLPMTETGSQYVLTVVDYFTKYVMLFALPRKDGTGVNRCIKQYISILGAPKRLISDQGKEFCNKVEGMDSDTVIDSDDCVDAFIQERASTVKEAYDKAKTNQEKAHLKQKKGFEQRKSHGVKSFTLSVGQLVLKRKSSNIGRKGGRCDPLWTGPYSVVGRALSFHSLSLQREIKGSCTSVSFDDDMVRERAHFLLADTPQPGYWVQRAA